MKWSMKTEKGLNEWDSGQAASKRSASKEVKCRGRRYMCQEQEILSGEGWKVSEVRTGLYCSYSLTLFLKHRREIDKTVRMVPST